MRDKLNITYDLETLGTNYRAPIVQIAAVKFQDDGTIISSFERYVDLEKLDRYADKFSVDYKTLKWWFSQSDEAIKSVFNPHPAAQVDLRQALFEFVEWIANPSQHVYWTHATFDPPRLDYNFTAVGINNPIPFRANRDIRTLSDLYDTSLEFEGIKHNALDDAIFQSRYISKGIQRHLQSEQAQKFNNL